MFVASGVILAGLLLIVVANLNDPSTEAEPDPFTDIEELIIPPAIPEDIFDEATTSAGIDQDVEPMLERGAWIQVADEDGRLAQQYRCQSLSPNPDDMPAGWFVLPEALVAGDLGQLELSG